MKFNDFIGKHCDKAEAAFMFFDQIIITKLELSIEEVTAVPKQMFLLRWK